MPCSCPQGLRLERHVHGHEELGPRLKVLTRQHANHGVGFAVQVEGVLHCFRPPAEVSLPEAIGEHDDPLGLLTRWPVRLGEDAAEERRNPEHGQSAC